MGYAKHALGLSTFRAALFAGTSLVAMTTGPAAFAQSSGPSADDDLDVITVTATRRENVTVQDVPASVRVLTSDILEQSDVRSLTDLEQLAPSVQITQTESAGAGTLISVRGIGTVSNNPGFEPSVGVLIDGVFRTRTGMALSELPELDSVEILRGPQGTLFGRNTSAGAISINTAAPADEAGGSVTLSLGDYDAVTARGVFNLPLGDGWGSRIDAVYREREGFFEEVNSGDLYNNVDRYALRGQISYSDDVTDFRLIADFGATDEACCASVVLDPGASGAVVNAIAAPQGLQGFGSSDTGDYETTLSSDRPQGEEIEEWGLSAQYDRAFDGINFTSITAYRDWEIVRNQDIDGTAMDRSYREGYTTTDTFFSQEFRLQGERGGLNWLVGAYYLNQELDLLDRILVGSDASSFTDLVFNAGSRTQQNPTGFQVFGTLPGVPSILAAANPQQAAVFLPEATEGQGINDAFNVVTNAFALFTHNEWSLSDSITLTTGLRYTSEDKELEYTLESVNPSCDFLNANPATVQLFGAATALVCSPAVNTESNGTGDGDREDSQLLGTVKLAADITDRTLVYASYSRGFKSGGFNLARSGFDYTITGGDGPNVEDLEFEAETIDAYEIGFNSTFADGRMILNGAAYIQEIEDYQVNVFNGNNFVVFNVPAEGHGFELDLIARPTSGLTWQSGLAYTSIELTEDLVAGNTVLEGNEQLARTPEVTFTNAISYEFPLTNRFEGLVYVDSRYVTDQSLAESGAASEVEQDAFELFGARVGLQPTDGHWSLSVTGENLFDEEYLVQTFVLPEQDSIAGFTGTPRMIALELNVEF